MEQWKGLSYTALHNPAPLLSHPTWVLADIRSIAIRATITVFLLQPF